MNLGSSGGQAFPGNGFCGMALRDYFAAKALTVLMQRLTATKLVSPEAAKDMAEYAYQCADAMMSERAK